MNENERQCSFALRNRQKPAAPPETALTMNHSSLTKLTFVRYTAAMLLGGLMLLNPATSQASVLYSCPGTGTGGDFNDRGFYMPSYPGITLDSVTLKLVGYVAGTYQVSLTVRSNAFSGPVLGTSTVTVALNAVSGAQVSTTFPFASVPMPKGGWYASSSRWYRGRTA